MFEHPIAALDQYDAEQESKQIQSDREDDAEYLMFLDSEDLLRNDASDRLKEERMLQLVTEGKASDWAVEYAERVEAARKLRTCIVNLHSLDYPPPFNVVAIMDCWSKLDPNAQVAIAWLAQHCVTLQEEARPGRLPSP